VERVGQSKRDRAPDRERKGTHTLPRRYSAIPNCWTSASSEFFIHEQAAVDSLGNERVVAGRTDTPSKSALHCSAALAR
jgi:hypothetical protein